MPLESNRELYEQVQRLERERDDLRAKVERYERAIRTYNVHLFVTRSGCSAGDMPWVVGRAWDEYCVANNEDGYIRDRDKAVKDYDAKEIIVSIPEEAVVDLFSAPVVHAREDLSDD